MTATQEAPKKEAAALALKMEGGLVQCGTIDEAYRFANCLLQGGLVPASFKTPQAIITAIQMGAELGLKPMASLKAIGVINGRAALYGDGLVGVVLSKGQLEDLEERFEGANDDLTAIVTVKRKGVASPRICTFSVADAKKAGLWGKDTWSKYPKDMLMHKARARAFKLFADILCGLPVYEDIREVPAERGADRPPTPDPVATMAGIKTVSADDVTPDPVPAAPVDDAEALKHAFGKGQQDLSFDETKIPK